MDSQNIESLRHRCGMSNRPDTSEKILTITDIFKGDH